MGYLNSVSGIQADGGPVSGGGLSQNGKFSYGYASSPGKRSSMEDFYETRIDGVDGKIVGLFGVFDGHGGARAAEYVKEHLFSNLIKHPKFISDTKSAIADAYNHTDSEFLKSENTQNRDAGSTASTAILVGDRLLVANVGDSRAVICRGGKAFAVSRDHKPDQTDERQRIEDAGGFVMWAGTWRVGGVLAVSRAFGDRLLKQFVVADPEIQEELIDHSLEFLILASDGLWDVVTNDEAVAMIQPIEDPEQAAKRLLHEAYHRGSADNITCVVVRFLVDQESTAAERQQQRAQLRLNHESTAIEQKQHQPQQRAPLRLNQESTATEQKQHHPQQHAPLHHNQGSTATEQQQRAPLRFYQESIATEQKQLMPQQHAPLRLNQESTATDQKQQQKHCAPLLFNQESSATEKKQQQHAPLRLNQERTAIEQPQQRAPLHPNQGSSATEQQPPQQRASLRLVEK